MIDTKLWTDRRVRGLGPWARCVVAFLMTSHVRQTVPGLVVIGRAGLAEAMGAPVRDVSKALDELEAAGLVELDEAAPLLCLVPAPEWDGPPHTKAVMAWRRQLEAMPASPLVGRHVARLRVASTLKCPSDVLETALAGFGTDNANDGADIGTVSEGYPEAIPLRCTDSDSDSDSDKDSDTDTDPAAVAARVFAFWQTDAGHTKTRLDPKRLARIKARLAEGFSAEDLETAIRNRRNDPWLMGTDTKSTRSFDGIETLLRDAAQVERLRDLTAPTRGGRPAVQGGDFDTDAAKARGESWLTEGGGGE